MVFEAPDGELIVEADELRLSQVLRNLLTNATRHTQDGSVTVSVTRDRDTVRVQVKDTGEGIPKADLPHIFERFYRADSARASKTGGAGLGLAISRTIIEDHSGTVFADSDGVSGACVGFTLPLVSADAGPK